MAAREGEKCPVFSRHTSSSSVCRSDEMMCPVGQDERDEVGDGGEGTSSQHEVSNPLK